MNKKKWCFIAGLCLVGISALLFVLQGQDSVVVYHDQLDGEVLCYLYQAKYLFQKSAIAEFMNGAGRNALTPPALLFVLLYKFLSPFTAFAVCQYIVMLTGFAGMYLLLVKGKVQPWIACLCSVLFAYLPLLPVYGLSMEGIPLAVWAFWCLSEKKEKRFRYLACLFVLALSSSLVLSGFAVLLTAVLTGIFWKQARKSTGYWCGVLTLLSGYLVCNFGLIAQLLGVGQKYVTHKEELQISGKAFGSYFVSLFLNGAEHAQSYQKWIVLLCSAVLLAGVCKKEWRNTYWKIAGILFVSALGIACCCALYGIWPVVEIRSRIGGILVWFQAERIYWLYPALWYIALGVSLQWMVELSLKKWGKGLLFCAGVVVYGITAVTVLLAGNWKVNCGNLLLQRSEGISWKEFYAQDVMEQVQSYLQKTTGQKPEEYRVVSLGICPAAALYNGFYCLDGYSNNYPLEYKHNFRKIIEPELEKSEYLTDYFDNWGNRCYICSAETPGYFTVEKNGFYYTDFEMNVEAFQNMGGKYVLSAAYIEGAERTGLTLLREEPFETESSYYRIYLYGVW